MITRTLGLLLFCSLLLNGHGQGSKRFFNLKRSDGLSSGSITSIVQDHKGLIWIGTKQGINRYDGYEFIQYHTGNSSIESNDISALLADYAGNLWVGTNGGGLFQFRKESIHISKYESRELGEVITSIKMSDDSSVWVHSNLGIACISGPGRQRLDKLNFEVSLNVETFDFQENLLWIATKKDELIQIDQDGSQKKFDFSENWPDLKIQVIHSIDDDNLFIGTRRFGLLTFAISQATLSKYPIQASDIRDIIKDREGKFWIGTDGHGSYKIENSTISNYTHNLSNGNSLVSNAIHECFEDRDGNIWFGSAWDGISLIDQRLNNLDFYYSDFKGLNTAGVLSIYIEKKGLWFGTDGFGLSIQNPGNLEKELIKNLPAKSYIQFIDNFNGRYWIGTFQSGLYIIDDKLTQVKRLNTQNSLLSHNDVRDVLPIGEGNYLIATWGGGLNILNESNDQIRALSQREELLTNVVTLEKLSRHQILVGTYGQGLFIFDASDFSLHPILPELHNILSIMNSTEGVWIGTWGEGLHFSEYPFESSQLIENLSLPNNSNIFSINASNQDDVWISTNERIFKISKSNLKIEELPLPAHQFLINASEVDTISGHLYFGSTEGVLSLNPNDFRKSQNKKVELLDVKILDDSLRDFTLHATEKEFIQLPYDKNFLTFEFSTTSYPSSKRESYEIKLEPVNTKWINLGRERSMTYADLNPGDYTFNVRNVGSKLESKFRFEILNPWWKTGWAYFLFTLLFMVLLYFFRKFIINLERVKNQLEIEKLGREKESEISEIKQRFFINVSHEIKTPLTLIFGEVERLAIYSIGSKKINDSLTNLQNNCAQLLQLVNELLDFRKLDQGGLKLKVAEGNFVLFCREIYLSFVNKADSMSMDYRFHSEDEEIVLWYDRDQLEKVFTNLLSNAFKNTRPGGKIEMQIKRKQDSVVVVFSDSGDGIPESEIKHIFKRFYQSGNNPEMKRKGFGLGLSIVSEIIDLHHGTISVKSKVGEGSHFSVYIKSGLAHFKKEDLLFDFENSNSLSRYKVMELENETTQVEKDDTSSKKEILIAEDNTGIRQFIKEILLPHYNVIEAKDGIQAFELIQKKLPDMIVSDIMMPILDGITLTKRVKQDPRSSHIPVILLTARTGTVFKKEGYETGADDYITKPFNSTLLISRIENIFNSRDMLRGKIRNEIVSSPKDLNLGTPDERFLNSLVEIINSNLDNAELNSAFIASEMGISHSVIYKKLKSLTGLTLVEFIRDYRLQQAAEILSKYGFSVAEACYKVGFSDKKYFSSVFKKKFSKTPSEFIKKSK